ncbi:MAG: efflux RND transporter periplasmic adaptor subunit, partial [Sphingobacteriaceae bacterium]|nr:efflux RND transporter periplasmic adaptor subunit [Sphingobacteriaceae bacterium]
MKNIRNICLLVLVFSACTNTEKTQKEEVKSQAENKISLNDSELQNIELSTTELQFRNISSVLKANGKIDVPPQNLISISVPLGGYLRQTKLLPGMHVNKGEVIATIEDPQYVQLQQDYLLVKSKLQFAELDYTRQKDLNESQANSNKSTQLAQAELNNQRINLNSLSEKLRLININPNQVSINKITKSIPIYSPITGFVSKVNANIGRYISSTEVLFELINPTDIHLNLKIYEKDAINLKIGQKVITHTNTNPTKKYECEIILISKNIDADGTTEVHCHFETYDKTLLPGMYMNGEIELALNKHYTLPEDAIVSYEGKNFVFIQTDKHNFEIAEIQTAETENGFTVVLNPESLKNKTIIHKGA